MLVNVLLAIYPTEQLLVHIKKPRLALVTHWMIWWYLFSFFLLLESLGLDWMPFWYLIKTSILITNYHPSVSSFSIDFIKVVAKKIKKDERFKLVLPYWNQGKSLLIDTFLEFYQFGIGRIFGVNQQSNLNNYISNSAKIKLKNQ
jgi:hypothetical protein